MTFSLTHSQNLSFIVLESVETLYIVGLLGAKTEIPVQVEIRRSRV